MKFRSPRPSPAFFVAVLALVIAMSGSAVAVSAARHGGDTLISKRSLSGNRLRLDTVTGKEVNESRLGQVPSANLATHVPALVWHNLTFVNGWQNYNVVTGHVPAYAIDVQGIVHLRGMINNPLQSSFQFATIPAEARPIVQIALSATTGVGQGAGSVVINADGTMSAFGGGTPGAITSLDGLTYTRS